MGDIPRPGDQVHHVPSEETWLVVTVSPDGTWLCPGGLRPTAVPIKDCRITYRCTDDEHRAAAAIVRGKRFPWNDCNCSVCKEEFNG